MQTLGEKPFENIVGKGENTGDQHFPKMFSNLHKKNKTAQFELHQKCRLQILCIWTWLKCCRLLKS